MAGFLIGVAALGLAAMNARALTTNFFEGFETGLTNWVAGDANPNDGSAYWGRVDAAFGGEGTQAGLFKAYCAGSGFAQTPASPLYADDMLAYLSRTIDLTGYTNGTLSFWYKLPSVEKNYDRARVLINETELWSSDDPQTSWRLVTLSLEPFVGQTNTLTFEFQTDGSFGFEGWYLDSITVSDAFTPAPPPSHDNFTNAQLLVGSVGSVSATTRGATAEPGEPDPGNSIWYRWSPYTNGLVTFRTGGSIIPAWLCVYAGSTLLSLNRVGCADRGDTNGASLLTFNASRGTVYRISLRGVDNASGFVQLSWEQPNGIGPELLPDLTVWSSAQDGYLYGWYLDQDEPNEPMRTLLRVSTATPNSGRGPLELRGTSTTPGVTQRIFRADGSTYDREAGVFTFHPGHGHLHFDNWLNLRLRSVLPNNAVGDIVAAGHKTSFAIIDLRVYNPALPGAPANAHYEGGLVQGLSVGWADVYSAGLQDQWVDVTEVPSGRYWLEAVVDPENNIKESNESNNAARILIDYVQPPRVTTAPANDHFSNAFLVTTIAASFLGHNTNATRELGEPRHYSENSGGRSVWWRWIAPTNMTAVITTDGSTLDTVLAVYTGSEVSNLVSVVSDDDAGVGTASRVSFEAVAGEAYSVAVDSYGGTRGTVQLNINPGWNDAFGNALNLDGLTGTLTGSNTGATRQGGEPLHPSAIGTNSVWYSWTAPFTGPTTIDTIGSLFDTLLAVYTGTAVNGLSLVASDNNSGGNGASRLTFNAVSNVTYRIAVDGPAGANGLFRLNWSGPSRPRITEAPGSTNVVAGGAAFFSVKAVGTGPLSYQWQHAGTNLLNTPYIQGALTPTMRVTKTLTSDAGVYTIVVTNVYGAVTSSPGNLIVLDNPRVVYVPETVAPIGGVAVVPINAQLVGNENTFRFTLQFDPALLSNPQMQRGADLPNSTVTLNTNQVSTGRLGAGLSLPVGRTVPPGQERELLRVFFDVSPAATPGATTPLGFGDSPTSRTITATNGAALTTLFAAGFLEFQTVTNRVAIEPLGDGYHRITLHGLARRTYAIEFSADLNSWDILTTAAAQLDGSLQFTDSTSGLPQRFYRATLLP
jgi:hypothetical protein